MEEFVTLYYGNFTILGEQAKEFVQCTGCSNWVAGRTLWGQMFLNELKREQPGWTTVHKQEWRLFLLEHLLHNVASMKKKEHQRCSQRLQVEAAEEMAPEHPSMWTLIVATDEAILQVAEQVYWGEWTLALSVLSCKQQDDCMRELWQELNRCMSRAGLQDTPGSPGPSRSRCSCGCSALWTLQNYEEGRWPNAKRRLPDRMVWVTKVTFPIEEQQQVKVAPKDLTTMLRQSQSPSPSPQDQVLQVSSSVSTWVT